MLKSIFRQLPYLNKTSANIALGGLTPLSATIMPIAVPRSASPGSAPPTKRSRIEENAMASGSGTQVLSIGDDRSQE